MTRKGALVRNKRGMYLITRSRGHTSCLPVFICSGYLYEHGLGVPVDYDRALSFYDWARRSLPVAGADVDEDLGMPIQLLVFIAKAR